MAITHNLYRRIGSRIGINKSHILLVIRCKSEAMKYLNVAEKNDAAKNIAAHLSRGTSRRVSFCTLLNSALKYTEYVRKNSQPLGSYSKWTINFSLM